MYNLIYISYINIYIFFYQAHIHVLKVNPQSTGTSSVSYQGSQPARICSKKLRVCAAMLLVEALPLSKCLMGERKYIYRIKNLKGHCKIT